MSAFGGKADIARTHEARSTLQRLKELQPNVSIAWCEEHVPYTLDQMPKFLEGLRKAGLQ